MLRPLLPRAPREWLRHRPQAVLGQAPAAPEFAAGFCRARSSQESESPHVRPARSSRRPLRFPPAAAIIIGTSTGTDTDTRGTDTDTTDIGRATITDSM